MGCLFLKPTGICSATDNLYTPSAFELEEYCQSSRHKMCPFSRIRRNDVQFIRSSSAPSQDEQGDLPSPSSNKVSSSHESEGDAQLFGECNFINTLLVVDDNQCIRNAVALAVRQLENWAVVTAEDGMHALEIFDSRPITAILTDISMPVMDGLELIRQVQARRSATPIFVMSAYFSEDDETRLSLVGVNAERRFEKPFDFATAVEAIASCAGVEHVS